MDNKDMNVTTENEEAVKKNKVPKKNILILIGIAAVLLLCVAAIVIKVNSQSTSKQLAEQLDLGNKYLEGMDYEQAIVAFNKAIEIDPMSVDAYLGLVEVYEKLDDLETALETCQVGYDKTMDERLGDKIVYFQNLIDEEKIEKEKEDLLEELNNMQDELHEIYWLQDIYLTDEYVNGLVSPVIEMIEKYFELFPDKYETSTQYLSYLSKYYLMVGEYEKCLQTRKKLYYITGEEKYNPEGYISVGTSDNSVVYSTYDEFGRMIRNEEYRKGSDNLYSMDETKYGENGKKVEMVYENYYDGTICNFRRIEKYEYDTQGRCIKIISEGYNSSDLFSFVTELDYNEDGFVEHFVYEIQEEYYQYIFIDKYGHVEMVD